jgi:hypothetical protein
MWQEKYGTKADADLSHGVAPLHLTLYQLRGTVEGPIIPRIAHARPQ